MELCEEGAETDSVNPAGRLGNAGLQLGGRGREAGVCRQSRGSGEKARLVQWVH